MPIFLHVGCGRNRKDKTTRGFNSEDWIEIRLDIDKKAHPDVLGSMTDMSDVETSSVDAVFSSHNIEHLNAHEVPIALKEFLRVLKSDGFAVITCPDLQSVCQQVAQDKLLEPLYETTMGIPVTPIDILYGFRPDLAAGKTHMAHRYGFTVKVMWEALKDAGFQTVALARREKRFDLFAVASKSFKTDPEIRELAGCHFPLSNKE
jgi:SAM-dependent methyltransferase